MSGATYLQDLVARALQQAPVVEPRRASRFEPLAPASGFDMNGMDDLDAPPAMVPAHSSALPVSTRLPSVRGLQDGQPATQRLQLTPAFEIRAVQPILRGPEREQEPSPSQQARTASRAPTQVEPLSPRPLTSPSRAGTSLSGTSITSGELAAPIAPPPVLATGSEPVQRGTAGTPEIRWIEPKGESAQAEPSPAAESLHAERWRERIEALEATAATSYAPPPPVPVPKTIEPALATDRPRSAPASIVPRTRVAPERQFRTIAGSPAPPETVIQVTIGRIEVRATQAPPAAARRRGAPPKLDLETYLRRREGA
jgi:hypothetical protein